MTEPTAQSAAAPKDRLAAVLYFASIYFVSVGALYLWGYWSTFHVNILEYIGLTDIIKSTAFPIASAFGFLALGVVLGELTTPQSVLQPGGGAHTKTGVFLRTHVKAVFATYIAICLAVLLFGPTHKWLLLPILLAIPITIGAKRAKLLETALPNDSARNVVLFMSAILPLFAYGHGRMSSEAVISAESFEYVLSPLENMSIPLDASPMRRLRYLGHAGEFVFFWEPAIGATVVAKIDASKPLVLKHFAGVSVSSNVSSHAPTVTGSSPSRASSAGASGVGRS